VSLVVTLTADTADRDIADLGGWLDADDELRGCVRREPAPVRDGTLGGAVAQLVVSLGSGGAATALAGVIITWLRRRAGSVTVRLTRPDGSTVEMRAERVRALAAADLRAQVEQLAAVVWPELTDDSAGA